MDNFEPPNNLGPTAVPPLPSRNQLNRPLPSTNQQSTQSRVPALPPRRNGGLNRTLNSSGYGPSPYGYGQPSSYSPFQRMSPYYQYSTMPRYSGYSGYGSYGAQNPFVSLAEQSALPAFQSIESIVHAFGSVSMMLESSYHAVRASFQAVLGVAVQFSTMKLHISQVFSALATFRLVKYLYRKLVYLMGIQPHNPELRKYIWKTEEAAQSSLTEMDLKAPVKWPILLYLGLTLAAPYLIWKLLGSLNKDEKKARWDRGEGEHYIARAMYPFTSQQEGDLSFGEGQMLVLAPRSEQPRTQGWLLGSYDGISGLVPANYIRIISRREGKKQEPSTVQQPDLVQGSAELPDFETYFNQSRVASDRS